MPLGKLIIRSAPFALALTLAGCGSSSSSDDVTNALVSAVQDLTLDPTGVTTTITFSRPPGVLTPANFASDGTASPVSVVVAATEAMVAWDERMTPGDSVQVLGVAGVSGALVAVTTSDATAPTFTITDASQNPGLGTDTLEITFAGPRVVTAQAEDLANWTLTVNTQALDLTGSTFTLDEATQVLDVVLGPGANLHAAFRLEGTGIASVADVALATGEVVGAATGDTTAPTLVSASQNLAEDEYGRVVDFTFSEAMDPVFSTGLARFGVTLPEVATSVAQPSEEVLRVTFSGPVVPGVDDVTLSGLVDAHGNAFPDGPQAVTQPSPAANTFSPNPTATTVENAFNDVVTVVTTQAFEPDSAGDPASWTLTVDGSPVDLSTQTVVYDFLAKTLTVTLDFDLQNGDPFEITGNGVLEVDGESFNTTYLGGFVGGDAVEPTVASVLQNRTVDPKGQTLDVQLSEDVDAVGAQNVANWSVTGGVNVLSATLQPNLDVVRLALDAVAVPGDVTVSADGLEDLAGNAMSAPQTGIAVTSTDTAAPSAVLGVATAVEGALNDTLVVIFDDAMIEAEVEDPANWTIESPVGTPVSATGASINYSTTSQRTTLVFGAGTAVNLKRGDDWSVAFATMRDVGGNVVSAAALTGPVAAETNLPTVHAAYRDAVNVDEVVVRFSEPCDGLDDVYDAGLNPTGTRYVLRTAGGALIANATGATAIDDGLGARVSFGVVVGATDTVDVIGLEDLAGNPLFPTLQVPTVAEDATQPSLDLGLSSILTVSGEGNDVVTVVFDRPMSPWRLTDLGNYVLDPGTPVDLSGADVTFDGDRTVTIELTSREALQTADGHDLTVNNVRSAQGVERTVAQTELGITPAGDTTAPSILASEIRLDPQDVNSLLVEVDEALDRGAAETAASYDYDSGNLATSAVLIGPRTVRATFGVVPVAGQTVDVTVTDLAGNASGVITRSVTAADTDPPLIVPPVGTSVPGLGGDTVVIGFNEPVEPSGAVDLGNYIVHNGGGFLDLTDAVGVYDSSAQTVTIELPEGQELSMGSSVTVTISGVQDLSGNALPGPVVAGGSVGGDTTPPALVSAFAQYGVDPAGLVVDVLFDEDVEATFVEDALNWSASGGQAVTAVTLMNPNFARVTLDAPLAPGDALELLAGLTDVAGNASVTADSVVPEL